MGFPNRERRARPPLSLHTSPRPAGPLVPRHDHTNDAQFWLSPLPAAQRVQHGGGLVPGLALHSDLPLRVAQTCTFISDGDGARRCATPPAAAAWECGRFCDLMADME
ncbi:hypothetical protein ACKKBG_A13800 [Auxenochlorella protothecoides x Auxenochlorella symbiontica]